MRSPGRGSACISRYTKPLNRSSRSRKAHISSFDDNQQVLAIHHLTQLDGPVRFEDEGTLEDVFGKGVPMMDQKLGWREVDTLQPQDFHFASDREAWGAWLARRAAKR